MSVALAYDVVTDRVIAALEEGTVPWRRPWRADTDHPRNLEGRLYRGINVWMLLAQGYASPHWMTFHQAKAQGGFVRAGEHATPIVFWKQIALREDDSEKSRTIPLLRYYQVFNVEQVEGIAQPPLPEYPQFNPIQQAEVIVAGMPNPPAMRREGNRAAYIPGFGYGGHSASSPVHICRRQLRDPVPRIGSLDRPCFPSWARWDRESQ